MKTTQIIQRIFISITFTLLTVSAIAQSASRTKPISSKKVNKTVRNNKSASVSTASTHELNAKGHAAFNAGQFSEAEKHFRQAVKVDPQDNNSRLMLAITLYRLERYTAASDELKYTKETSENKIDIHYYKGLIQYQNKHYDEAIYTLQSVKNANSPKYSASAAFYKGLCLVEMDRLEEAKTEFEYVLDNSQDDPELDKNAEARIEDIARRLEIKKIAAVKYFVNLSAGLGYDSNILYSPDNNSASSSPYDEGGLRWVVAGDGAYRFFYNEKHELSAKLSIGNMQSFSTDFVQADPRTYSLSLPYARNGQYKNKNFRLTVTPVYEQLFMDFDRSGEMTNVNNAYGVGNDFTLYMTERWYSGTYLEFRHDDSKLPGVSDDENADANKFTVRKSETLLLGREKKKILIATAGFTLNAAKGREKKYTRPEVSLIYSAPIKKYENTNWLTGIAYYRQSFDSSTNGQIDSDLAYMFGLSKTIDKNWSWTSIAMYTINDSNDVASDYSKYQIMGSINYAWSK